MDNITLIILGCLVIGWLQFATIAIGYSALQAKHLKIGLLAFIVWLFVAVVVSVVVIDQFIVLGWLVETNFHICGK